MSSLNALLLTNVASWVVLPKVLQYSGTNRCNNPVRAPHLLPTTVRWRVSLCSPNKLWSFPQSKILAILKSTVNQLWSRNFEVWNSVAHWLSQFLYMEAKFGALEKKDKETTGVSADEVSSEEHPVHTFWPQKEWRKFGRSESRTSWRETKKMQILLLCLCFLTVIHVLFCSLPWLRFFRAFPSAVRQMPGHTSQRRGTARTLP